MCDCNHKQYMGPFRSRHRASPSAAGCPSAAATAAAAATVAAGPKASSVRVASPSRSQKVPTAARSVRMSTAAKSMTRAQPSTRSSRVTASGRSCSVGERGSSTGWSGLARRRAGTATACTAGRQEVYTAGLPRQQQREQCFVQQQAVHMHCAVGCSHLWVYCQCIAHHGRFLRVGVLHAAHAAARGREERWVDEQARPSERRRRRRRLPHAVPRLRRTLHAIVWFCSIDWAAPSPDRRPEGGAHNVNGLVACRMPGCRSA